MGEGNAVSGVSGTTQQVLQQLAQTDVNNRVLAYKSRQSAELQQGNVTTVQTAQSELQFTKECTRMAA